MQSDRSRHRPAATIQHPKPSSKPPAASACPPSDRANHDEKQNFEAVTNCLHQLTRLVKAQGNIMAEFAVMKDELKEMSRVLVGCC